METVAATPLCKSVPLMAAPTVLTVCNGCVHEIKVYRDNVYMVECVGVDSSLFMHGLGYTEDFVDYWVWL